MKKFISKFLTITITIFLIDYIIGSVLDGIISNLKEKNCKIANLSQIYCRKKAEMLILGASRAKHGYDTRILASETNMSVYNAGIEGTDMVCCDFACASFFDRCHPKIVILDIAENQLNGLWVDRIKSGKMFYGINEHITKYFNEEMAWNDKLKIKLNVYRHNNVLNLLARYSFTPIDTLQGYEPLYKSLTTVKIDTVSAFIINHKEKKSLDNIVALCQHYGSQLIICISPATRINYGLNKWLADYCNEHEICLLDYSNLKWIKSHPDYFYDRNHINQHGANAYCSMLVEDLRQKKVW